MKHINKFIASFCLIIWLESCLVHSADDCINFGQIGDSTIAGETILLCNVTTLPLVSFQMNVRRAGSLVATLNWTVYIVSITVSDAYYYSCEWRRVERSTFLVINNTRIIDDGEWECEYQSNSCTELVTLDLNVAVPPTDDSMVLLGLDEDWVDRDRTYPLSCTVDPIKPDASVYWRIGDHLQLQTSSNSSLNPDGKTFRLEGRVEADFSGVGAPVLVECLVTELDQPENILMVKEYKTLEIWYRPSVVASGASQILEGSTVTLGCHKTDGYPEELTRAQWMKDGEILTRSGIEDLDDLSITIQDVIQADAGAYVCILSNLAGDGYSNEYQMEVFARGRTDVAGLVVGSVFGGLVIGVALGVLITVVIVKWRSIRSNHPPPAQNTHHQYPKSEYLPQNTQHQHTNAGFSPDTTADNGGSEYEMEENQYEDVDVRKSFAMYAN